ncbi:ribonuclease H-like domain-containing protein [Tanacetum coccineum]
MANLEFGDTHNMVAYLLKPEGSKDFQKIVDFLNISHIKFALTENPNIYTSLIQQFWQTASTNTLEDEEVEITATIDGQLKTITEASLRRHLKLEDADGISSLPNSKIFEQLALIGPIQQGEGSTVPVESHHIPITTPSTSQPPLSSPFRIQEDVGIQGRTNADTEILLDQEEPTELVGDLGSGEKGEKEISTANISVSTASATPEVSTAAENLVYIRRSAEKRKDKGKAIMKEDESVQKKTKKQLEQERLGHEEAIRLQEQINEEERQRIARDAEIAKQLQEEFDRARQEQEVVAEADQAHDIDWSDPAVLRYHAVQNRSFSKAEVRKNMCIYLKNQGGYKLSHFKGMSYEDIRPIFERVWDQNNAFVPKDSEIEKEVMKRPGFNFQQKSSKKRSREDSDKDNAKKQKLEDDAEKKELRDSMDVVLRDDIAIDVESLATKYPIVDWKTHVLTENMMYYQIIKGDGSSKNYKIFSEMLDDFDRQDVLDLHRLVQERYDTTSPEGYDLLLWGDLKILFEPNEDDEIWKNQQDYNLISWRLFDSCGIHMLLMHTGIAIHMMIEKKYPLTQEMLSRMLSRRLEVDQESEMAFELLSFLVIFIVHSFYCITVYYYIDILLKVMEFESAQSNTTAKLPILKLGEYEMWVIRIKQYFQVQDYALWEVTENGNSWVSVPQTAQENGSDDENHPPPPPQQTPTQQAPHTVSTIKLPILKKGKYDIWAIKMEHYLSHTDYPIWEVIQKGNGHVSVSIDTNGVIKVLPPKTAKKNLARERERKARTTLLMALPEDHLENFHKMTDAKEMWDAIKSRFGGNDESKKMQKYILKQQFEGFSVSNSEGLHKVYDRFKSLLSQLEIHGAGVSTKDVNQKFLRSLPSSWSQVSFVMRTKPGVDSLNFDDLYNNLRVFESDVKGSTGSSSSVQNVAFVSSESTSGTNDVSTAYGVSTSSGYNSQRENSSSYTDKLMYSFFANQSSGPYLDHEDLEQLDEFDLEEMDLKWQVAMISIRLKKFYKKTWRRLQFDAKEPIGFDKTKVECFNCHNTGHFARECRSKGNQESKRRDAGNTIYKAKDNMRRPGKQEEPKALVTLDGEGVDWTGHAEDEQENFATMAYSNSSLDTKVKSCSKECVKSYAKLKKLYDEQVEQVGDASIEIQAYTQALKKMSTRDKSGLGYGDQVHNGVLNYENEVFQSVFDSRLSDVEDSLVHDRFANVEGMHAVPSPMTGNYMPSRPDKEVDDSMFTYGLKQSITSESDTQTSNFDSCVSNSSVETLEFVSEPVVVEPKVFSQPKVWSDAPNIEEYKSDSDDEYDNLQRALKNKRIVDSRCFRHMTGNKAYLVEYQDYNGGPVAFGGSKGYITGKDTECLVLSSDFKLPDENQVLLRIPRQNNMYSFNLENIVSSGSFGLFDCKGHI